ncbi:ABC transporter ATP-binding protein [Agrobacterium sp. a22-2]|uniref:ABC transporter ATP-binding protein n=1 Tax=Agrobacterium sp. a22-2 TaxID=2283840 RepID=UPI001447AE2F|nr:ABC transporter ATP-binding protein [Agrobacterium sp. a22-2]NKN37218.1 ABC transporter ATP-binding protein [Agrobacterium sp. a22-2]
MAFLEISGLRKRFGAVEILKGIDLELEKGGFLVLVGPSGCGKSTLLNTIAGLEAISSGEILVDGRAIGDLHPSKRDIAMVFQSYALYPNMTVAGNMSFGMEMRGVPADERKEAIDKVAKVLQISHLLDRKPSQLSGGQRQRVAMGRALVRDPKLFLFDEPLSNLDAKLRVDMRVEIKRLHQATGTTIVYVTHDQIEAMTLATKIAVMRDGEVQQFGSPAEIYNNPTNMFVADFMGSPAMNLLSAMVQQNDTGLQVVLDRPGMQPLRLPVAPGKEALGQHVGREVVFGIRPEALTDPDGSDRNARTLVEGECLIDVVEPAGSDTFAVTKLGTKHAVARLRADARIHAGQTARLAFNLDKAVFFDPASQLRIA